MGMESAQELRERTRIGKQCGIFGMLCNLLLSVFKIVVGTLSSSMSIQADGWNNLSDAASSIVTLIGFKLAEKPADKEHPYGHARFEYLASLVVVAMILVVGFEVGLNAWKKILHPQSVRFSTVMLIVLVCSIAVKLGMFFCFQKMGRKIQSGTLLATAQDSRNDVITTVCILLAGLMEALTGWKVDGLMSLLVSLFILYGGIQLAKETISPLLGEGVNQSLREELEAYIKSEPKVLGCHDLMVHDYGPGKCFASIHVEMDKDEDIMSCHELLDTMERECLKRYGVHLVIHYDPVITGNPEIEKTKEIVLAILRVRDERLSLHDFRVLECEGKKVLNFDISLPSELDGEKEGIRRNLEDALNHLGEAEYQVEITFDLC